MQNVIAGSAASPLPVAFVVAVTLCRLFDPIYVWLYPGNFLVRSALCVVGRLMSCVLDVECIVNIVLGCLVRRLHRTLRWCACTSTPLWRRGPDGTSSLCNACGVKFKAGKIVMGPELIEENFKKIRKNIKDDENNQIILHQY